MNFKKEFCLLLSVMIIVTAFSASAVSASAETGMPGTAFGGSRPPEKPDGEAPGEPPEGMGGPSGGMGTPPDSVPGGEMGTPPDGIPGEMGGPGGGMPGGGPGSSSADIDYSGAVEITSADTQENQTYETSAEDQSALLISTAEQYRRYRQGNPPPRSALRHCPGFRERYRTPRRSVHQASRCEAAQRR